MVWKVEAPEGNEAAKIRHLIVPYTRGRGLDLGCGPWKAWPGMIGVDNFDEWTGFDWRPDIQTNALDLQMFGDRSLDYIFSSHLLEHITDTKAALKEWYRVIKPGGHLVLYLPHRGLYPNIGQPGSNPDHKHDFVPEDLISIMDGVGGYTVVENEKRETGDEYSFFLVFEKEKGSVRKIGLRRSSRITRDRTCLVIRYGGYGDMVMAASVLPKLKARGWHVVFNTTPKGKNILRNDPHIDEWFIQDDDQVPNEQLAGYWEALGREFGKVINLCESVEGTFLALPGRRNHAMPHAARHALMNLNYIDFTHALAEVEGPPEPRFFPAADEEVAALELRKKYGPAPVILWTLAGSSVHKVWPWTDIVCAWLLDKTPIKIIFAGDMMCQILEHGICQAMLKSKTGMAYEDSDRMKLSEMLLRLKDVYGGQNRMICRSGSWPIRQTMTFARYADLVIGPETGILNAVSMEPVPKIVMLSHSSHENLTRDWVNCTAIAPPSTVPCYPCHRLHKDRTYCPEHTETGASICAAAIAPEVMFKAIIDRLTVPQRRTA